jgi:putative ABC transport system permease protein
LGSARAPATLTVVGETAAIPASSVPNTVLAVDSGYFNTLRIAVSRGRAFSADDREESTPVAMINEWAASRWFAGRDPVGARLQIDSLPGQSVVVTIVGIVKDNRAGRGGLLLADDGPELYRPFPQSPSAFPTFFVRLDGAMAPVLRPMRAELGEIVLGRPVSTTALSDAIARQLDGARTTARQILAFSAVGLILALIGVYAVLSYSVKRRTRELGIRRALGATASGVYGLIVRDALVVAVPGVLLGAAGALYTARFVAPLLHGTSAYDSATFLTITAVVLATAVLAAVLPAVRASRVSPLTAIRTS